MPSRSALYNDAVRFKQRLAEYFTELGRKSVKDRMEQVSPERRKEIAKKAANARWGSKKKASGTTAKKKVKKKS